MSKRPGDPGYAAGWCVHYRYNRKLREGEADTCEAGVEYATFANVPFSLRPCFLDDAGHSRPGSAECAKLRLPTAEEISLHEQWAAKRLDTLRVVMVGILPWRQAHKGKSASEIVECPACNGRLHLSIERYNGHIHGKCETPGCVSFIE